MIERFMNTENKLQAMEVETFIPEHVAIIMDGNGRWAERRGYPRIWGHREGMKAINKVVEAANARGVKILTLFVFSTENWKRPKAEVDFILRLPHRYLSIELPKLQANNVRVRAMGEIKSLPPYTFKAIDKAVAETAENDGLVLNLAINYGGRSEIIKATQELCRQVERGEKRAEDITEKTISEALLTSSLPDPDLLIRTSGEIRLSNFMLWQIAYSEFWFTDVLWPDFSAENFFEALDVYQKRKRRYGGV